MKKVIIRKRIDLKYLPSYKWESLGFHEDSAQWFSNCHKTKQAAIESVERLKKPFPIGNKAVAIEFETVFE